MNATISRFVTVRSPYEAMRKYYLISGKNSIGRNSNCEIKVLDAAASRLHAEINYEKKSGRITIIDNESTNGTFVNGKRLKRPLEVDTNDVLRIGRTLISFLSPNENNDNPKSIVTGELVMESIDNYSILLHDISTELIHVPDLNNTLQKISELIKRMIGAEECSIILFEQIVEIQASEVPPDILKDLVTEKAATIYGSLPNRIDKRGRHSGYKMVAPVLINSEPVALILAKKGNKESFPFNQSDLMVVIAISHQIALAIQRNKLEDQLIHNAMHDNLTGLPNRSTLIDRLKQSIDLSSYNENYSFALLFLDVDNFKTINDYMGHMIGDQLLKQMSHRIMKRLQDRDTIKNFGAIARFGGDEFAILLVDLKKDLDPVTIAQQVADDISEPFVIDGKKIEISVSIGITTNQQPYGDLDEVLRDADIAMYRAKEAGKNRIEVFDQKLHSNLMARLERQNAVSKAYENKELLLHYQPIICLHSGRMVGCEALLRWYSEEYGIISANEFVDTLNTTQLIHSINDWIIKEASQQFDEWKSVLSPVDPFIISMNFSSASFQNNRLFEMIKEIINNTAISPENLWIEITEEVGLNISKISLNTLMEIHSLGVRICLDDFGTGFSAINYLIDFPVDIIKIDKSIIARIDTKEESHKITNAIISLAKQLDLQIVSEGIENSTQLALVKSLGCDFAQGYFFGKPLPGHQGTKWLASFSNWKESVLLPDIYLEGVTL